VKIAIVIGAGLMVLAQLTMAQGVRAETGGFSTTCAVCHQLTGRGVPGIYPPLADTVGAYVRIPPGRRYLMHVVINGMAGPIVSHKTVYNGLMPSFANLDDGVIAATLNQVLFKLNGNLLPHGFKAITASEVHGARADKLSATAMSRERARLMKALGAAASQAAGGEAK
jgi:hypothetical protein